MLSLRSQFRFGKTIRGSIGLKRTNRDTDKVMYLVEKEVWSVTRKIGLSFNKFIKKVTCYFKRKKALKLYIGYLLMFILPLKHCDFKYGTS